MTTADGFQMTEAEYKAWRGQPEYITCCTDEDCDECDGLNLKANPEHPVHQP